MTNDGYKEATELHALDSVDEFIVVERLFSNEKGKPSIGLANIHAVVPGIEENKSKIERACRVFKERGVNLAVFPEFCISGTFWDDPDECWPYMRSAMIENHWDWVESNLFPLLDDTFQEIVLNGLTESSNGRFLNTTFVIAREHDYKLEENSFRKIFIPGIEAIYTDSGRGNRLVIDGSLGRYGFTTCYDYLFVELLREYAFNDHVDAIVQTAAWRALSRRDYPNMNVRTDQYYGQLWNMVMAASSATNQVWTIACNSVGQHAISKAMFWGGSGLWAPSGINLVQASNIHEELLIIHNVDIPNQRKLEKDDFDYAFDFEQVYRQIGGFVTRALLD